MATAVQAHAKEFAREVFRRVERSGCAGEWVAARRIFDETRAAHPGHPYVRYLAEKPGRRIGFSTVAERVRRAEFPHLERRKAGVRRNAPVQYRVAPSPRRLAAVADVAEARADATSMSPLPASHALTLRADAGGGTRLVLRRLRRHLSAAPRAWWRRMLEPVVHAFARLRAAVAGR